MLFVLLGLITIGVWLFCLFDVLTTNEGDTRFLPKFGWFLVVLLGLQIGAILWLLLGRPRRALDHGGASSWSSVTRSATEPPPEAPKGPDDDPDFLKNLDRRIKGDD